GEYDASTYNPVIKSCRPSKLMCGGVKNTAYLMATDEITLDVRNDSVVVHIVKPAYGADMEDPQLILLAKG
ncbi:hypothetical protein Tco_0273499, partial [Tanacetum coccineum]